MKLDRVEPVGEVVADDRKEDDEARRVRDVEGEADPEPVEEAVYRERRGAEGADGGMGVHLLVVVPVVQHERPLGEEEPEEARADEPGDMLGVAEILDRLRQDVEERDGDDDTAG